MVMAMAVSGAMLFAQADARFTGTVLDQSGATVAGATVVVKDEKTGQERTVLSNAEGRYLVTNLKPSVYTLRATFKDFAPLEYPGMQLVAAQEFSIDLELRPAGLWVGLVRVGEGKHVHGIEDVEVLQLITRLLSEPVVE